MRICITGARGRLGRVLRKHLQEKGHHVFAFSRNQDLQHLSLSSLEDFVCKNQIDWILHAAWSTVPSTAEKMPGNAWIDDLPLLSQILRLVSSNAQSEKSCSRLLFLSTCAVYGELTSGSTPFSEESPLQPKGWYSAGKVAAESLIEVFDKKNNVKPLILRVSNPYGFIQEKYFSQGVIPAMIHAALGDKPFSMWGSGEAVKDFIHINDFCSGVHQAMVSNLQGTFNLVSGRSSSLAEIIEKIQKLTGKALDCINNPCCEWDVRYAEYSNIKLKTNAGWHPETTLEEGLERQVHEWLSKFK